MKQYHKLKSPWFNPKTVLFSEVLKSHLKLSSTSPTPRTQCNAMQSKHHRNEHISQTTHLNSVVYMPCSQVDSPEYKMRNARSTFRRPAIHQRLGHC